MRHPRLVRIISTTVFWLSWPLSYATLNRTERTRVLVLAHGAHILLVRSWHAPQRWVLPGGGIQPGETDRQGAQRELYEETSVAVGEEVFAYIGKKDFQDRGLWFHCRFFAVEVGHKFAVHAHPPEVLDVAWLSLSEIEKGNHELGDDVIFAIKQWKNLVK